MTDRVDSPVYTICSLKFATYDELLHKYNDQEFLDLYDIVITFMSNKLKSIEEMKRKNG